MQSSVDTLRLQRRKQISLGRQATKHRVPCCRPAAAAQVSLVLDIVSMMSITYSYSIAQHHFFAFKHDHIGYRFHEVTGQSLCMAGTCI